MVERKLEIKNNGWIIVETSIIVIKEKSIVSHKKSGKCDCCLLNDIKFRCETNLGVKFICGNCSLNFNE